MDSSITFWHRIEPSPRHSTGQDDLTRTIQAQVRDPLWFLTRQWQFGEFQGEDAASPTYVQLRATTSSFQKWRGVGEEEDFKDLKKAPLSSAEASTSGEHQLASVFAPLEDLIENEGFTLDVSTAVELGQQLEGLLKNRGVESYRPKFRELYPVTEESQGADVNDLDLVRFVRVCAKRSIDGIKVYQDVLSSFPNILTRVGVAPEDEEKVRKVLEDFKAWIQAVFGEISMQDPSSWRPERLEYGVQILADVPHGKKQVLEAHPDREGEFNWYTFDYHADSDHGKVASQERIVSSVSVLPTSVRFRGMPNARFWQFEHGLTDFGGLQMDLDEVAKLIVSDFLLVHSNDWFVLPVTQQVGSLFHIDQLLVHDVFGGVTVIRRAEDIDRDELGLQESDPVPWSMYTTTVVGKKQIARFFILPPSAASVTRASDDIEEVRFLRDEMANMVWAIEHTAENGIGQPLPGHERAQQTRLQVNGEQTMATPIAPLVYRLQTTVPEHWFPFIPIQVDAGKRQIALRKAIMRGVDGNELLPKGRILRPSQLRSQNTYYDVREEEVPRTGTCVSRVVRRSRWVDGSTHIWVARKKQAGQGEGSSGLRFDVLNPAEGETTLE